MRTYIGPEPWRIAHIYSKEGFAGDDHKTEPRRSFLFAFVVYQATPRDPLVLACVVLAMLLLGLMATWILARRALSVDPMILLREE